MKMNKKEISCDEKVLDLDIGIRLKLVKLADCKVALLNFVSFAVTK